VEHVNGDVLDGRAGTGDFDAVVSMLCFLHIPDRATLFARCAQALVPGGALFVDDYYEKGPLTAHERDGLAHKVFCPYLPDLDRYVVDVEAAGFSEVSTVDKTADWTVFVTGRLERFRAARTDLLDRYGIETVDGLDDFYATVAALFGNGRLGGLRLTARLG